MKVTTKVYQSSENLWKSDFSSHVTDISRHQCINLLMFQIMLGFKWWKGSFNIYFLKITLKKIQFLGTIHLWQLNICQYWHHSYFKLSWQSYSAQQWLWHVQAVRNFPVKGEASSLEGPGHSVNEKAQVQLPAQNEAQTRTLFLRPCFFLSDTGRDHRLVLEGGLSLPQ